MKRFILGLNFFLASSILFAQEYTASPLKFTHEWSAGKIIFNTGDSLSCKLRYNRSSLDGVVHLLDGDEVIAVTASYIHSFSFYDDTKQRFRDFIKLTLPAFRADSQQFLVEKLYDDGRFSIVNQRTYEMPYQNVELIRFLGKPVPVFKKYIRNNESGEVLLLTRENTLKLLQSKSNEVSTYIHERHLRFRKISDFIEVFQYHSSL
jgi:hypothetical protein